MSSQIIQQKGPKINPLPKEAQLPEGLGDNASPWLDEFVKFAKKWSPRSYEHYFEASAIWVLSVISGRRVGFHFGKLRHTNLYIALIGLTSVHAKTTVAEIAKDVILQAGLGWYLLPDTITPQKMVMSMTGNLPKNFTQLSGEPQDIATFKIATAGQRGWHYDEFGMQISGMMRRDGPMADFRGILRIFDDTPDSYENATIGRGNDLIQAPFLSLLAIMTPADLARFANQGSALWGDGFLARFALVTPPNGSMKDGRFPIGPRVIPASLITPLRDWHERLRLPKVEFVEVDGQTIARVPKISPKILEVSEDVVDAYYRYDDAMRHFITKEKQDDLHGNLARFPEKAFRVAALLASLADNEKIEMPHWARGQKIAENWREGLYELYYQVRTSRGNHHQSNQQRVLRVIDRYKDVTARKIAQNTHLPTKDVNEILDDLKENYEIQEIKKGKTSIFERA